MFIITVGNLYGKFINYVYGGLASHFSNLHFLTAQLQIEELTRKLRTGDMGISPNPEERCGVV